MVLGTLLCSSATCCMQNSSQMRANNKSLPVFWFMEEFCSLHRNCSHLHLHLRFLKNETACKSAAVQMFLPFADKLIDLVCDSEILNSSCLVFPLKTNRTLALRPNPASNQPCIYPELGACHLLCRWWVSRALLPKEEAGSSSAPLKGTKVRWRHALFHITYYSAAGVSSGVTGVMPAETEESGWKNIHWIALKLLIWFVEVSLFSDVPVNRYACSDMGNYLGFCCISQKT